MSTLVGVIRFLYIGQDWSINNNEAQVVVGKWMHMQITMFSEINQTHKLKDHDISHLNGAKYKQKTDKGCMERYKGMDLLQRESGDEGSGRGDGRISSIMMFSLLILFVWFVMFIDLHMLSNTCIFGIKRKRRSK